MNSKNISEGYSKIAKDYANEFYNELDHKPTDRYLFELFCSKVKGKGTVCDMGCGPGHITEYIYNKGIDVVGMDLSLGMLDAAKERNPELHFERADMLALDEVDKQFAGIISHYSIVHFRDSELMHIFKGLKSLLIDDGILFLAFHIGNEELFVEELFGKQVNMDYIFHDIDQILSLLKELNFNIIEAICREPYDGYEYPSKKGYIVCQKAVAKH